MREFEAIQRIFEGKLPRREAKFKERSFGEIKQAAELSMGIIEYMTEHPFCSSDELLKASGVEFHKAGHGDLVRLARLSVFTRDANARAYKQLAKLCAERSQSLPRVLFDSIKSDATYVPQGHIQIGRLDNPFALEIYVKSKSDFNHLLTKDAGGIYSPDKAIKLDGVETSADIIAIHGSSDGAYQKFARIHELAHAHNGLLESSLESVNRGKWWASKGTRGSRQAPDIALRVLADAKDEALAMVVGDIEVEKYFSLLGQRGGTYDYIQGYKIADPSQEEEAWTMYQGFLQPQLKAIGELRSHYVHHGLDEWKKLLPWFFRQVPIEAWKSTIERFRMI